MLCCYMAVQMLEEKGRFFEVCRRALTSQSGSGSGIARALPAKTVCRTPGNARSSRALDQDISTSPY